MNIRKLKLILKHGMGLRFFEEQSYRLKLLALSSNGNAIKYIKNPTELMKAVAVSNAPHALEYIKEPSEDLQIIAVSKNGSTIQYINNPSLFVQQVAQNQNREAALYIKNPHPSIVESITLDDISYHPVVITKDGEFIINGETHSRSTWQYIIDGRYSSKIADRLKLLLYKAATQGEIGDNTIRM